MAVQPVGCLPKDVHEDGVQRRAECPRREESTGIPSAVEDAKWNGRIRTRAKITRRQPFGRTKTIQLATIP